MSAETLAAAAPVLTKAAQALRTIKDLSALESALADWLEAEAKQAWETSAGIAAVNVLLILADRDGQQPVRVKVGYDTSEQALVVARQILGGDDA